MNNGTGVNKVFLVGYADEAPELQIINGKQFQSFRFITIEEIKRGPNKQEHAEVHHINIHSHMAAEHTRIKQGDLLYIQGRIQTRPVVENEVKLYKTEIFATSIEYLSPVGAAKPNEAALNGHNTRI